MESRIADALGLVYAPVALLFCDEKPKEAQSFSPGKWGCVMWLLAAAARGKIAAFSRQTYGCWGGGVGLGFGDLYASFPGGHECFHYFLSTGNAQWEKGRAVAGKIQEMVSKDFLEHFLKGEGYLASPKRVKEFIESLPITEIPSTYVVAQPLSRIDQEKEIPQAVVLFVTPDQLAALVILANYDRPGNENVIIPYAAGCQTIGIYCYREARSETPRAVVGLTDISARLYIARLLGQNIFSFSVPWRMFLEMEKNVAGSFLEKRTWKALAGMAGSPGGSGK